MGRTLSLTQHTGGHTGAQTHTAHTHTLCAHQAVIHRDTLRHTAPLKYTSTARLGESGNMASATCCHMKTYSDLVVRRGGRGELHVACYQIRMNPLNVTLHLIRCSLRRRVQRRSHERAPTPDFTDPIHSRLQALARTNRPARARAHTGISGATGDERGA